MSQFLICLKSCSLHNLLKTTSKNNLSIRLGINKLKTCQPALINSFANRTVPTSKWRCIWLSVLKLSELLLENVGCLSRFALNKAKVGRLWILTFKIITMIYLISDTNRGFKAINKKGHRLTSRSDFTGCTDA